MLSAPRFHSGRRVAVAARAQTDEGRHTALWLAGFLVLSSALAAAEIRSEALTVGVVSQRLEAATAIPPDLVVTSRSTADAASVGAFGFDKD
jgi:hypothetical protein